MTDVSSASDVSGFDVVSFLSDYGRTDESVGVITAVVHDLAPHASVVHLTHDVAPFDVRAGSLALARSIAYVPAGVVLAIVDPRGATHRRPIAVEVAGGAGVLVGPDNGLLAPAVALAGGAERAVVLDNTALHLSDEVTSFRGRDVYAPVVAALLNGADLTDVGSQVEPGELLPGTIPLPRFDDDTVIGEVLWVDRFGNVQLNIGPDELPTEWGPRVQIRLSALGVDDTVRTAHHTNHETDRGDVPTGAIELVGDAFGMLTLTMIDRSAATELAVVAGDRVVVASLDDANRVDQYGSQAPVASATPVDLGRRHGPPESTPERAQ